ncbi:MAG TPA: hypothetical protein VE091_14145 [Gemmatimonadales bacterium]|nr:hypothetical protein [Gemmatimonadales bacterium]
MPSLHPGWRIIGFLAAILFFGLAAGGIMQGRFQDPETGTLDRAGHPLLFWLSTLGLVLMGSYLLAIALGMAPAWLTGPASSAAPP